MNSLTSSLSSFNKGYTFPFLSTNPSFMSIAWSQIFRVGILSDCFLPKTLIHLWNFSGTHFFASSSNLAVSSFLFQISHSSATLFTSIVFSFFDFFFFPLSFSSYFLPAFSFAFTFATLIFLALVSTAFHTLLEISLFSPLLSSSQFPDCGKLTMVFPRLPFTSTPQSHLFLSSFYVLGSKYSLLPYV